MVKRKVARRQSTPSSQSPFKQRDYQAFEKVITQYDTMVFNLVYRLFKDYHQSLDATQEIFIKIFNQLHTVRNKAHIKSWIYRIALNYCYNYMRANRTSHHLTTSLDSDGLVLYDHQKPGSFSPEALYAQNAIREKLQQAITLLPTLYSKLIILFHYEQLSYKEIAEALNISISNVGLYLHRARKELKKVLKRDINYSEQEVASMVFSRWD